MRYRVAMATRKSVGNHPLSRAERRTASEMLECVSLLEQVEDEALRESGMTVLREAAAEIGVSLYPIEVTHDPMPDPLIAALPAAGQRRIESIVRRLYDDPAGQHDDLSDLVAAYPRIPALRNHLACALSARGEQEAADALIEETVRLFPDYLFGFANHVMGLLADGKVERAREILEKGPRGPLLFIGAFAPSRTLFHATEVVCYTGMTGYYFIATGQMEAAKVALKGMKQVLPRHPMTKELAARIRENEKLRLLFKDIAAPRRKLSDSKSAGKKGKSKG